MEPESANRDVEATRSNQVVGAGARTNIGRHTHLLQELPVSITTLVAPRDEADRPAHFAGELDQMKDPARAALAVVFRQQRRAHEQPVCGHSSFIHALARRERAMCRDCTELAVQAGW